MLNANETLRAVVTTEEGTRKDKWLCQNRVRAEQIIAEYIARYDPFQRRS